MSRRKPEPAADAPTPDNETPSPTIEEATPAVPPTFDGSCPAVFTAIHYIQGRFSTTGLAKDRHNQQQGYKFRGIDDVYNSLATFLMEARMVILPRVLSHTVQERASARGGLLIYTTVSADYVFVSTVDGTKVRVGPFFGEAMDSADKSTNKAMSAAYKYMALQTFCIPTEGDNDADGTTPEPLPKQQAPRQPAQQQERAQPEPRQPQGGQAERPQQGLQQATNGPRPQRDTGSKQTVAFHIQAIKTAKDSQELRSAFALAWKQYESPDGPSTITDAQQRFKDIYNERRDALIKPSAETQQDAFDGDDAGPPPDERDEGESLWPDGA